MKRARIILMGVVFLSALTFAACGSKKAKESKEGEKKECCEKKDTSCCAKKDSTSCKMKCPRDKAACDSAKTK